MGDPREDPFTRHKDQLGSIYETVQRKAGIAANPLRLPTWPNPVNYIVDFDELSCDETWQGTIKFAVAAYAAYAWATFVPSPAEIFRKTLTGGYRCGFYFMPKFKSPLRLFISEGGVKLFAEFIRPFTTALFWWWVAESVYGAFATWQTVMHRAERCIESHCSTQEKLGVALLVPGTHNGVPGAFTKIQDDCNMDPGGTGVVGVNSDEWTAACAWRLSDPQGQVTALSVEIMAGTEVMATETMELLPNEFRGAGVLTYHHSGPGSNTIHLRAPYSMNSGPASSANLVFERWTVVDVGSG